MRYRKVVQVAALLALAIGCRVSKPTAWVLPKQESHGTMISSATKSVVPYNETASIEPLGNNAAGPLDNNTVPADQRTKATILDSLPVVPASYNSSSESDSTSSRKQSVTVAPNIVELAVDTSSTNEVSNSKVDGTDARVGLPIDLPTALRLADADSLLVALSREQIQQAQAAHRQASALWMPSLRAGVNWNHHEGPVLSSSGDIRDVSRGSLYGGAGAFAVGGGSPAVPGISANFHFADAIFQPLAAQQRWGAREQAATATRNNVLLDVALAYLELLRSHQDVAIAKDQHERLTALSKVTDAYAKTGQGLQSDADRMQVELGTREIDIRRSQEAVAIASARLAQTLRLDSCVPLQPLEQEVVELNLVDPSCTCNELVVQALSNRPELKQNKYLVGEAVERLRREKYASLVPSVLMGASYGGFGGGRGASIGGFDDRFDFDAAAFWEIRNLGIGESAVQDGAKSRLRQAQLQNLSVLDQVARETTEAYSQVTYRKQQIGLAREVIRLASDSYEHNFLRIKQGQGLPIEALQSVQALLQSRREYLKTLIDYNSAQFTLQRAIGWPASAH